MSSALHWKVTQREAEKQAVTDVHRTADGGGYSFFAGGGALSPEGLLSDDLLSGDGEEAEESDFVSSFFLVLGASFLSDFL